MKSEIAVTDGVIFFINIIESQGHHIRFETSSGVDNGPEIRILEIFDYFRIFSSDLEVLKYGATYLKIAAFIGPIYPSFFITTDQRVHWPFRININV